MRFTSWVILMEIRPLFTVFTPTYNRAHVIHRVYESLLAQTFRDFEWLVVDDGSTDGTRSLIDAWRKDPATWFPIRYVWQENRHKKSAHNLGVREARGVLFLPLDSDDLCVPEALERFAYHWFAIPEVDRDRFSAVTALCVYEDGSVVGDRFPCEKWIDSNSLDMHYRYGIKGEKWGFQRVDVLKQFLFPEDILGHVPEGVVWAQIARSYKTRFINETLRIYCQDDVGDVQQITRGDIAEHAAGHLYWKRMILSHDIDYFRYKPMSFILDAARLTRFYLHCNQKYRLRYWPDSSLGKLLAGITVPVGLLWWLRDRIVK